MKSLLKQILLPFYIKLVEILDRIVLQILKQDIIVVLYYHRISDICHDGMTVSPSEFDRQIRYLKEHFDILSPDHILRQNIRRKNITRRKAVLITFDDGYLDNYTTALPILEKYNVPAIFFISTGLINNNEQFKHDLILHPGMKFKKMTWQQVGDAAKRGISIGLHTHTHINLGCVEFSTAVKEIERSIKTYLEHFDTKHFQMSYPFGKKQDITPDVLQYIKSHKRIDTLHSAYGGRNIGDIDMFNIKRINMGYEDKGLFFRFKLVGEKGGILDYWTLIKRIFEK